MRALIFAKRNLREILRSPLSYIFCVGFPVVMLLIFQIISRYTRQAYWFEVYRLAPGICVFSFLFVTLFMALLVSHDRASAFLTRLYTTRMTTADYLLGYAIPGTVIGLAQVVLCYLTSLILLLTSGSSLGTGGITGVWGCGYDEFGQMLTREMTISYGNILLSFLVCLPMILFCVMLGIFIGTGLNENAAPGVSSAILSGGGLISGAWMPLETMGNFETICRFLPFYPAVDLGRLVLAGEELTWERFGSELLTVFLYLIAATAAAMLLFRHKMRNCDK